MPPSHGLTGFAAIETVAKKNDACPVHSSRAGQLWQPRAARRSRPHRRLGAAAGVSRPLALGAWRDLLFSRAQSRRKYPFGCLPANTENAPDSLQKQEQIQGPEKRPIARFYGLCCYQIRSEKRRLSARGRQPERLAALGCGNRLAANVAFVLRAATQTGSQTGDALPIRRAAFAACSSPVFSAANARITSKSGANKRPRKRLHRTV